MSPSPEALTEHLPGLRRYARLLSGDATRTDDLLQDTMERACASLGRWPESARLRPWLLSVMHNLFIDQVRARRLPDERGWPDDDGPDALPNPRDEARGAQIRIDLARGLQRLSPEHRAVLPLVCVEDFSYDEAAAILAVPVGTVMSRLSRARAQLRFELDGESRSAVPLRRVK